MKEGSISDVRQHKFVLIVLEVRSLKCRYWQSHISSGNSRGGSACFSFLASMGCLHFSAQGPLPAAIASL